MADDEYKRLQIGASLVGVSRCSVTGCESRSTRKGLCNKHYLRIRAKGNTDDPQYGRNICSVADCVKAVKGYGYCANHLDKQKKYGDPLLTFEILKVKPPCSQCGGVIPKGSGSQKHCSVKCYGRLKRGIPEKMECSECNSLFDFYEGAKTCSDGCAAIRKSRTLKEWNEAQKINSLRVESRRLTQQRRRAKINGAESEIFSFQEISDRDKWMCALCGVKVDGNIKYPDKMSPSIDHIVPISKGGGHTKDNVQLTHLYCNMKKSASGELIGKS